MNLEFEDYFIEPIEEKDAWKLCDFISINSDRLKRFFPITLQQNLTPTLSQIFVELKVKQFAAKEEFLFKLKDKEHRKIVGLVYIKELNWQIKQGELAYCIGYQYEGKGYTTQAVNALTEYAIKILGLSTLQIIAHKSNVSSIKVAEKCGYLWRRTLLKAFAPPGEDKLDMELYEMNA